MNNFTASLIKYLRNYVLVLSVTSIGVITISKFLNYELSNAFFYAGIIYIVIGGLSLMGGASVSGDYSYVQSQSIFTKSGFMNSLDIMNEKFKSYRFLAFMSFVGIGLIIICIIFSKLGIKHLF